VIPSWCSTTESINFSKGKFFSKEYDQEVNVNNLNPFVSADKKEYLDILLDQYHFLMRHKFDYEEYKKKTKHYIQAVEGYCKSKNIKLIETCAMDNDLVLFNIDRISNWREFGVHPTRVDHQRIARKIIETYKL